MRRPTLFLILAVALTTADPSPAQQPVAGTRVEAVQLDVIVNDASGKPVTGLTKSDFLILEDKKEQIIAQFSSEDAPLSIGVVFDCSGSMPVVPDVSNIDSAMRRQRGRP